MKLEHGQNISEKFQFDVRRGFKHVIYLIPIFAIFKVEEEGRQLTERERRE